MDQDLKIRLAAFDWLNKLVSEHGDVLPRKVLETGFVFGEERICLISQAGIFKPKSMKYPLTITTSPKSPYGDEMDEHLLYYRYRGDKEDINHRDNVGLREVMKQRLPLIYLHGVSPGKYVAIWPVYIVGDDPSTLTFNIAVDDISEVRRIAEQPGQYIEYDIGRRAYITASVKVRLHQRSFRERVLDAYASQCSLCRLKHRELLDAAHIIGDCEEKGEPIITNGISLCKIHHAAFDTNIIGITPTYLINVRKDILEEEDGPMLKHGLQGLHNSKIILPSKKIHWPDRDLLNERWREFRG